MSLFCSFNCTYHWSGGVIHNCWLGRKPDCGDIVAMAVIAVGSFFVCSFVTDWGILAKLAVSVVLGFGSFAAYRVLEE